MSANREENGPGEISRFRAVVVAALRTKQLRRGSKPRIEPNPNKHKDTSIAMEEVRRGLITFTELHSHVSGVIPDLKAGVEQFLPAVG